MLLLDTSVNEDKISTATLEEAVANRRMIDDLNYLIEEGFIYVEETDEGEIKLYPCGQ